VVVWVTLSAIEDTGSEAPLQCTDKLQMRLQLAAGAAGPGVCATFVSQSMLGQPLCCQMYLSGSLLTQQNQSHFHNADPT